MLPRCLIPALRLRLFTPPTLNTRLGPPTSAAGLPSETASTASTTRATGAVTLANPLPQSMHQNPSAVSSRMAKIGTTTLDLKGSRAGLVVAFDSLPRRRKSQILLASGCGTLRGLGHWPMKILWTRTARLGPNVTTQDTRPVIQERAVEAGVLSPTSTTPRASTSGRGCNPIITNTANPRAYPARRHGPPLVAATATITASTTTAAAHHQLRLQLRILVLL